MSQILLVHFHFQLRFQRTEYRETLPTVKQYEKGALVTGPILIVNVMLPRGVNLLKNKNMLLSEGGL